MLALSSKPIKRTSALKLSHSIKAINAPMEPKNLLKGAKLFTKYEKPKEAITVKIVATVAPGVKNLHLVFLEGAEK